MQVLPEDVERAARDEAGVRVPQRDGADHAPVRGRQPRRDGTRRTVRPQPQLAPVVPPEDVERAPGNERRVPVPERHRNHRRRDRYEPRRRDGPPRVPEAQLPEVVRAADVQRTAGNEAGVPVPQRDGGGQFAAQAGEPSGRKDGREVGRPGPELPRGVVPEHVDLVPGNNRGMCAPEGRVRNRGPAGGSQEARHRLVDGIAEPQAPAAVVPENVQATRGGVSAGVQLWEETTVPRRMAPAGHETECRTVACHRTHV